MSWSRVARSTVVSSVSLSALSESTLDLVASDLQNGLCRFQSCEVDLQMEREEKNKNESTIFWHSLEQYEGLNANGHFPAHRSRPDFFVAWIPQSFAEQTYLNGSLDTFASLLADTLSISSLRISTASQSSVSCSNLSVLHPGNRLSSGLRNPESSMTNPVLNAPGLVRPRDMASFALLPAR